MCGSIAGFWFLVAGYWLLASRFWLLVAGLWLLVFGLWVRFMVTSRAGLRAGRIQAGTEARPALLISDLGFRIANLTKKRIQYRAFRIQNP
jgi:hypothetical protein